MLRKSLWPAPPLEQSGTMWPEHTHKKRFHPPFSAEQDEKKPRPTRVRGFYDVQQTHPKVSLAPPEANYLASEAAPVAAEAAASAAALAASAAGAAASDAAGAASEAAGAAGSIAAGAGASTGAGAGAGAGSSFLPQAASAAAAIRAARTREFFIEIFLVEQTES